MPAPGLDPGCEAGIIPLYVQLGQILECGECLTPERFDSIVSEHPDGRSVIGTANTELGDIRRCYAVG